MKILKPEGLWVFGPSLFHQIKVENQSQFLKNSWHTLRSKAVSVYFVLYKLLVIPKIGLTVF